ncbi:hypothetical protein H9L39_18813 [Fusarium oxysporum f. sp. albedinis]|nr:hypothetical protein H9L39_18813 [Fusarium oxysporum f. sp. albedinis]
MTVFVPVWHKARKIQFPKRFRMPDEVVFQLTLLASHHHESESPQQRNSDIPKDTRRSVG